MSKRFTDTEKFSDTWYRKLSLLHKVVWEYLLAECNHAGILENFDLEMMSFKIGAEVTKDDLKIFEDRIIFISDDILFIPKFIQFQYGELNPQSKVHASVLKELEKYNLDTPIKEYPKSILTLKNKDKNKNKNNKEEEKEKEEKEIPTKNDVLDYVHSLCKKINIDDFFAYYEASKWKDKDGLPVNWKQKALYWANSYKKPALDDTDRSHIFKELEEQARKEGKI